VPSDPRTQKLSAQTWRTSIWVWPACTGVAAFVLAQVLTAVEPAEGSRFTALWQGGGTAAINVLAVVATSVMTATTLIFSLTVLALQLASQQFSPRLLRQFARDEVTRRVLSVLAASFVFAISAMSGVRAEGPVPTLAVGAGLLLGIASFGAILAFITHMVRVLRVDTMMLQVHDETDVAISAFYPSPDEPHRDPDDLPLDVADARWVCATRSGFVQATDVEELLDLAEREDLTVRIETRAGDHIVVGTPIATVWGRDGAALDGLAAESEEAIRGAVRIGYERTLDQDSGFGFRQLADIAVKAVSPSINDPVTAAHAVGHMADLLVGLNQRRLGPTLHADGHGVGRVIVPDRDLRYYLDLMCGQLRRFSAAEPSVLCALLRALRDVALSCRDGHQRDEVRRAADLVVATMDDGLVEVDAESVHAHRERVEAALDGDMRGAYTDRAGETRSM
jgi:uncharacterized membrane protein